MASLSQREARVSQLIGNYVVHTAGGIMVPHARMVLDGWLYANNRSLLFLADSPLSSLGSGYPGLIDAYTVLMPIAERPSWKLSAPFLVPNAILSFSDGVELVGGKGRMKKIAQLLGGSSNE